MWFGTEHLDNFYRTHLNIVNNIWLNMVVVGVYSIIIYFTLGRRLVLIVMLCVANLLVDVGLLRRN